MLINKTNVHYKRDAKRSYVVSAVTQKNPNCESIELLIYAHDSNKAQEIALQVLKKHAFIRAVHERIF